MTATETTVDPFTALREPFPDEMVGKLPRINCGLCRKENSKVCSNHQKDRCDECNNYMTKAHIHLDYVGHAAVTDRLLRVDPLWTWEPVAWSGDGLPLVKDECLWIRLTVAGHTRLGVGGADGKTGPDAVKEMIGDALRNAAMRFGVALDLWSKEDLHAAPPEPIAETTVTAELVRRMNALDEADRKRCKAMFVDAFGRPDSLRASQVQNASDMIAGFEQSADESAGGGDDSPPDENVAATGSTTDPEGAGVPAASPSGEELPNGGAQPAEGGDGATTPPSSPDADYEPECDLQDLDDLMTQLGLDKRAVTTMAKELARAHGLIPPRKFDAIEQGRLLDLLVDKLGTQDDDPPPSGSNASPSGEGGPGPVSSPGPVDAEDAAGSDPAATPEPAAAMAEPKKGTQKGRYFAQAERAANIAGLTPDELRAVLCSIVSCGRTQSGKAFTPDQWREMADFAETIINGPEELYRKADGNWTISRRPGSGRQVQRHRPRSAA